MSPPVLVGFFRGEIFQRLIFCVSVLHALCNVPFWHICVLIFYLKEHGLDVGVYHVKGSVAMQSHDVELYPLKGFVGLHPVTCNEHVYE